MSLAYSKIRLQRRAWKALTRVTSKNVVLPAGILLKVIHPFIKCNNRVTHFSSLYHLYRWLPIQLFYNPAPVLARILLLFMTKLYRRLKLSSLLLHKNVGIRSVFFRRQPMLKTHIPPNDRYTFWPKLLLGHISSVNFTSLVTKGKLIVVCKICKPIYNQSCIMDQKWLWRPIFFFANPYSYRFVSCCAIANNLPIGC